MHKFCQVVHIRNSGQVIARL